LVKKKQKRLTRKEQAMDNSIFKEEDVIVRYTSQEAEEDGILFNITRLSPQWTKGPFNYVTANLLNKGYFIKDTSEINIANLLDLLNQALEIVKKNSNNFQQMDTFFDGKIELPSGEQQLIFIGANETGKFTLMLPEDN